MVADVMKFLLTILAWDQLIIQADPVYFLGIAAVSTAFWTSGRLQKLQPESRH
jgi:hypothetical protein